MAERWSLEFSAVGRIPGGLLNTDITEHRIQAVVEGLLTVKIIGVMAMIAVELSTHEEGFAVTLQLGVIGKIIREPFIIARVP
jgi:hypothetical protein